MVRETIRIYNHSGLHLRPAGQVCRKAQEYQCKVEMVIGEKHFNLKSVLSVLSAQITSSREIDLICDGPDEERALREITQFLGENLDERDEAGFR